MKPEMSVVIPTWQRTHLLNRCLNALVDQDIDDNRYEIIIVTDGPDQPTLQFIQHWLNMYMGNVTITCISLPVKKGPAAARNAGWRKAQGELIVFTDDDTLPTPNCLHQYWLAYTPYRNTAIAFSGKIKVPLQGVPTDYEMNTWRLEEARFVTANCACSKKALESIGGLDEDFTMAWREDTALEFDLSEKDIPIIKVPEAVIVHPVRTAAWGISIKEQKKGMFNALLYKKHTWLYNKTKMERTPRYYYTITLMLLLSIIFSFRSTALMTICIIIWAVLTSWFTYIRLRRTSKSLIHVAEIAFTSSVIPLLSVYWTIYGAIKFKTFFI
ncbi:glycosyltransferase family 2 protein [Niastella sp. OAS944]|uniref:glycosyltransferase family 2 protein n=1 Tax=Niastella sp. OAS944 TaxID=2664089 RepID=UPI00348AAF49|nr:GT2 family glycosyltransferase [Chitinophagaceae bacterium OAS944]